MGFCDQIKVKSRASNFMKDEEWDCAGKLSSFRSSAAERSLGFLPMDEES